ncbi:unnamed protein product [Effrenium voratum]|nr:unnamed protein product [Effrenium voratum]
MGEAMEEDALDSCHQQLHQEVEAWTCLARQRLSASKEGRKRAEAEQQLLANRLRLLRQEEAKAVRIIEEVRKRTREVLEAKLNSQKSLQAQESFKRTKMQAIEQKKQENNWRREQARSARQQAAQEQRSARRRSASEQRAFQRHAAAERRERSPCLTPSLSEKVVQVPRKPLSARCGRELMHEEKELMARLRHSENARARRPPLPPIALEDEGPIKAALREARFTRP